MLVTYKTLLKHFYKINYTKHTMIIYSILHILQLKFTQGKFGESALLEDSDFHEYSEDAPYILPNWPLPGS